jgi:hypothetical protein
MNHAVVDVGNGAPTGNDAIFVARMSRAQVDKAAGFAHFHHNNVFVSTSGGEEKDAQQEGLHGSLL